MLTNTLIHPCPLCIHSVQHHTLFISFHTDLPTPPPPLLFPLPLPLPHRSGDKVSFDCIACDKNSFTQIQTEVANLISDTHTPTPPPPPSHTHTEGANLGLHQIQTTSTAQLIKSSSTVIAVSSLIPTYIMCLI